MTTLVHREAGWWLVGKGKGDEGGLRAREVDSGELPSEGWQWWDREAWREDSATISLHTNAASPCQRLELNNILATMWSSEWSSSAPLPQHQSEQMANALGFTNPSLVHSVEAVRSTNSL